MASLKERRDVNGKLISFGIRVHRGYDAKGKQLPPWTTTFTVEPGWSEKTARKRAADYAAVFEQRCKTGLITNDRRTFQEFCEYVLELKQVQGDKLSSLADYRRMTERIYPELGSMKLTDIKPHHLNSFYAKLSKPGENKITGGTLSPTTIRRYHRFISIVLGQATREGILLINPATRATPPKKQQKEKAIVQPDDLPRLLAALETESLLWQTMITLLLSSGLRRGEALGLHWSDVNFAKAQISITTTLTYISGHGAVLDSPKTERSNRTITLPQETMKLLKALQVDQYEQRLRLGPDYDYQGFVFANDFGKPIHPSSVVTWLSRFCDRHDLPHISPHSLRHTAASYLIHGGVDVVTVSRHLGHSQTSTTQDIYAHLLQEADQKCANVMESILLKKESC